MPDYTFIFTTILSVLYLVLLAIASVVVTLSAWTSYQRRRFVSQFLDAVEAMNPPGGILGLDRIKTLVQAMEPRNYSFTGSDGSILAYLLKELYKNQARQRNEHEFPEVVDDNLDLLTVEMNRLSTETPFERLGAPEAQFLQVLRGGQHDDIARQLANLIVEKDNGLARARKRARWATPLAILGLLVTLIFGIGTTV